MKLMATDIIEILDAENARKVISLAHDWYGDVFQTIISPHIFHSRGCGLNSRLVSYYEDRFEAFGFFAISYSPPAPFDLDAINAMAKKMLGYDNFGYWYFFGKDEAAKIIEEHVRS